MAELKLAPEKEAKELEKAAAQENSKGDADSASFTNTSTEERRVARID